MKGRTHAAQNIPLKVNLWEVVLELLQCCQIVFSKIVYNNAIIVVPLWAEQHLLVRGKPVNETLKRRNDAPWQPVCPCALNIAQMRRQLLDQAIRSAQEPFVALDLLLVIPINLRKDSYCCFRKKGARSGYRVRQIVGCVRYEVGGEKATAALLRRTRPGNDLEEIALQNRPCNHVDLSSHRLHRLQVNRGRRLLDIPEKEIS